MQGGTVMAFYFENLDEKTRKYMLEELEYDNQNHNLYISTRLNNYGINLYPKTLAKAASSGNEVTFASDINQGYLNLTEQRKSRKGGYTTAKVPSNAHELLAEGEFNRLYVRALCRRAIDENLILEVYRAKPVNNPRSESQAKIGQLVDPNTLLHDLRTNIGIDTALGIPAGPNSGLSVKISKNTPENIA